MKRRRLRNARALLTLGEHRLLIDPMLAGQGSMPGFKPLGGGRRPNPLGALPEAAAGLGSRVHISEDGAVLHCERRGTPLHAAPRARPPRKQGFQKRVTPKFTGT